MSKSLAHPALSSKLSVVGIDTALLRIGFGRVGGGNIEGQVLETENRAGDRLVEIYAATCNWLKPKPALAVIEGYSYDSEGMVFQLGEAGGVVRLACAQLHVPYLEVPPCSLKLFVAGNGSAGKETMLKRVAKFYGYETDDDNIADAVGLAMWGLVKLTWESNRRCELQAIKNLFQGAKKRDTKLPTRRRDRI